MVFGTGVVSPPAATISSVGEAESVATQKAPRRIGAGSEANADTLRPSEPEVEACPAKSYAPVARAVGAVTPLAVGCSTDARAVGAHIADRASVVVVAWVSREARSVAARAWVTGGRQTNIWRAAVNRGARSAESIAADIVRAEIAGLTRSPVNEIVNAASRGIAGISGAIVEIVAADRGTIADTRNAALIDGAKVAVVAGTGIWRERAGVGLGIADIERARVTVVTETVVRDLVAVIVETVADLDRRDRRIADPAGR
ncbi:MAG: hypothetical protein ACJAYU_001848 [Bradymonadia bacterium]